MSTGRVVGSLGAVMASPLPDAVVVMAPVFGTSVEGIVNAAVWSLPATE